MIYLAGPINGCTDDDATTWRDIAKNQLGEERCLDPMRRDYRGKEHQHTKDIVHGDLTDINNSTVILANCWQPSYGTAMELWYGHSIVKPIVVMVPDVDAPISPWLRYVATYVVGRLDRGIALAEKLANGVHT